LSDLLLNWFEMAHLLCETNLISRIFLKGDLSTQWAWNGQAGNSPCSWHFSSSWGLDGYICCLSSSWLTARWGRSSGSCLSICSYWGISYFRIGGHSWEVSAHFSPAPDDSEGFRNIH
jgi:hypothetical protein